MLRAVLSVLSSVAVVKFDDLHYMPHFGTMPISDSIMTLPKTMGENQHVLVFQDL